MILSIVLLIFISLFFSISETAINASHRSKFDAEAREGNHKSKKIYQLLNHSNDALIAILIGNYMAKMVLVILLTIMVLNFKLNIVLASIIIIVIFIVLIEILPKSIAQSNPDKITQRIYPIVNLLMLIFKPIIILVNKMNQAVSQRFINGKESNQQLSKADIQHLFTIARREGSLDEFESDRLQGVMNFSTLKLHDVNTTPRVNVVAFSKDTSYQEAYEIIMNAPYTRYPIYDENIDEIIGVFHSKYLLSWSKDPQNTIENYTSVPLFVNEHNKAEWVLRKMTITRKHLAIVLDEYGGTDAIVSHEDLIEEMLGMDIEDEMDKVEIKQANKYRSSQNLNNL